MRLDPAIESQEFNLLSEELRDKVSWVCRIAALRHRITVGVGCTLRGPVVQARMWCRSRTPKEVASQRAIIERAAPTLASLLLEEFSGLGPETSSHLPGQSWHQWGEAVDLYSVVGGKATWTGSTQKIVADICSEAGIFHSYNEKSWRPKSRYWHVQLHKSETPLMMRGFVDSWTELEAAMIERFEL